jgi:hypothetical protein
MSDKQAIMEAIQSMDEEKTFDQILDELAMLAELRRRLAIADKSPGVTTEEMKQRVAQWTSK